VKDASGSGPNSPRLRRGEPADAYRDDLEAAHARIDDLERENEDLRAERETKPKKGKKRGLDARSLAVIGFSLAATAVILLYAFSKRGREPDHAIAPPPPPPSASEMQLVATPVPAPNEERAALGLALRKRTAELKGACWDESKPPAAMRLHVELDGAGAVTQVKASGHDPALARCAEEKARTWTFERRPGAEPTSFEVPLRFLRASPLPSTSASAAPPAN
jgi:tetrahydromethanopterin S-methyltransferase subunit G